MKHTGTYSKYNIPLNLDVFYAILTETDSFVGLFLNL